MAVMFQAAWAVPGLVPASNQLLSFIQTLAHSSTGSPGRPMVVGRSRSKGDEVCPRSAPEPMGCAPLTPFASQADGLR